MRVLHLDENHPILWARLAQMGFDNHADYQSSKAQIESEIARYGGLIIRSRFPLDKTFLQKAKRLRFIGRVGAGLENIDATCATELGIALFTAPEGNRNAVGEHALALLLALLDKIVPAHAAVKKGRWRREANRGEELSGKTVGIIGYGNTGKAFAKILRGFDTTVLACDIIPGLGDENARQVSLDFLQAQADVLSLHVPQTPLTIGMVNDSFVKAFQKPFYLLNTARGTVVKTADLVRHLKSGRIKGAGLDVLEYEKSSFERLFQGGEPPQDFHYLTQADHVVLSPHVAGWTVESKRKLAEVIARKIAENFGL
ncbi:MAG: NAD(P)-dependent oxidoreductase [Flavobacteriales bacterium]